MAEPSLQKKKLEGKVAIIIGGASGIGEAMTRLLCTHGAKIVTGDIEDEKGQKVAESIGSNLCSYIHCDVSIEDQVQAMVEWTLKTHGHLDIMFSNGGIFSQSAQKVLDLDLSGMYYNLFSVNVGGMASCLKHAARAIIDQSIKGSIVCMASIAATRGAENWTDYCISKHAVLGLMRCASKQFGEHGIRVNCVSPYVVATRMARRAFNMTVEELEEFFKLPNLRGMNVKAKNVADAVLFLASAESSCITGTNLVVDGGFTS